MKKSSDEILRECIESSGYFDKENVIADLQSDDLPYSQQVSLILARELVKYRPDLITKKENDVVFIVCGKDELGKNIYSLPTTLTEALDTPPYDDSQIKSYSLSKQEFLMTLYKGNGHNWVQLWK